MSEHLLYSTNAHLKYIICRDFRNDIHYVWCSTTFNSRSLGRYERGSATPPSSDPAAIYRNLKAAVERRDWHDKKIAEQKAGLMGLAVTWEGNEDITGDQKEELLYMIEKAGFDDWRPLIYIIPRHLVEDRIETVPIQKRASPEDEYIVKDLKGSEFDIVEL